MSNTADSILIGEVSSSVHAYLATKCIICGDAVRLSPEEGMSLRYSTHNSIVKVCDNCRQSILELRKIFGYDDVE